MQQRMLHASSGRRLGWLIAADDDSVNRLAPTVLIE